MIINISNLFETMFKFITFLRADGVTINPFTCEQVRSYVSDGIIVMTQLMFELINNNYSLDNLAIKNSKYIIIGDPLCALESGVNYEINNLEFVTNIRDCIKLLSSKFPTQTWWLIGDNELANKLIWEGIIMDVHIVKSYAQPKTPEWNIDTKYLLDQNVLFDKTLLDHPNMEFRSISSTNLSNSKTMWHFMRRNIEETNLLSAMSDIITNGFRRPNRTGVDTRAVFGRQFEYIMKERIDPKTGESSFRLPLLTTKRMFTRGVFLELKWFLSGGTDSKTLETQGVNIWKGNTTREFLDANGLDEYHDGETGPIYGFQWRHANATYVPGKHDYSGEGIDQVANVINSIQTDPYSRRHVITGWAPHQLSEMCLPPCFLANTLVLTLNGYKDIQSLCDSDLVFTHRGNWKPILNRQKREYDGAVITIKHVGSNIPINATSEHPFLTKTIIGTGLGADEFKLSDNVSWTPASSLRVGKHLLCIPIEQNEKNVEISINIDGQQKNSTEIDWYMVGYYVGKGNHVMDVEFIPPGWSILKEFTNGQNATCDHIPEWVQQLPIEDIKSFIRGFEISAYGSEDEFIVPNELMALYMQRLYAKLYQFIVIEINNDSVKLRKVDNDIVLFDSEYMYVPIETITDEIKKINVYNLEVADDNSYIVENIATHNCHMLYQFMVHEENGQKYLSLAMNQRSCDVFLGLPFNICSLGMFLLIMAHRVNMKPWKIIHSINDMHLYETHINAASKQIQREPCMFPYIRINCEPKNNIEDYDFKDITIEDYYCHNAIKADMVA